MGTDIAAEKPLTAIFDLSLCNPNFEFFNFLVLAELERQARGCTSVHLVFVPGEDSRFYEMTVHAADEHEWRFQNLLVLGANLLPSCKQISILQFRRDAQARIDQAAALYPARYRLDKPVAGYIFSDLAKYWVFGSAIPSLAAPDYAAERIRKWLAINAEGRIPITITLRQDADDAARNSALSEWLTFLRQIDRDIYFPIVIPDTGAIFRDKGSKFHEFDLYPEFAVHILMRIALYEQAYVNLFSANGPAYLCCLDRKVRLIAFNTAAGRDHTGTFEAFEAQFGVAVGDQIPFCEWYQKLVFEPDTAETIKREFDAFVETAAGRRPPLPRDSGRHTPEAVAARLHRGRAFAQAREIYEKLLQAAPDRVDVRKNLAQTCLELRDYATASALAMDLDAAQPDDLEVNQILGDLFLASGDDKKAYRYWAKVEDLARRMPEAFQGSFIRYIWAMDRMNRIQELSQRFQENRERIAQSHLIYRAMGEALERRALHEAARPFLKAEMLILGTILENAPGQVELKARYADLQCEHGDPKTAAQILLPMLSSVEFTHEIFSSYAIVLEKSGREREALDYHRKAVRLSGKIVGKIALRLASLLYRLGEIDEALEWAEHCDTIAPDEPQVLSLLIEILSAAGQASQALRRTHELRILQNTIGEIR